MENIINGFDFGSLPISVTYIGQAADENKWEHFLWSVSVKTKDGFWTVPYKCGLGHIEKVKHYRAMPNPPYRKGTVAYEDWHKANHRPKKPSNSDIMHSLIMDSEAGGMSFNEWCMNYGYDNDSMKAFKIYQNCCEEAEQLKKAFSREQIEQMHIALEDY